MPYERKMAPSPRTFSSNTPSFLNSNNINKGKQQQILKFNQSPERLPKPNFPYQQYSSSQTKQISNGTYVGKQTISPQNDKNIQISQMGADLAKLKQQLKNIMNRADKFEKNPIKINKINPEISQNEGKNHKELIPIQDKGAIPVKDNINPLKADYNSKDNDRLGFIQFQPKQNPTLDTFISSPSFSSSAFTPNLNLHSLTNSPYSNQKPKLVQQITSQAQIPNFSNQVYEFSKNQFQNVESIEKQEDKKEQNISQTNEQNVYSELKTQPIDLKEIIQKDTLYKNQSLTSLTSPQMKKSSTNVSHNLILSKIIHQEMSKKFQGNSEVLEIRKKKNEQQIKYEEKIIELEHEKRKLKQQINNLVHQKEAYQELLSQQKSQKEKNSKKYSDLEATLNKNHMQLEEYKAKYKILEKKLQNEISGPKTNNFENFTFDETFKQKLSEIQNLKDKLQEKDEEISKLKDINISNRREIESLNNQVKIEQIKAISQANQLDLKHSIIVQDKQNEIRTLKNLISTLESKLEFIVKENKAKDNFMVQHLTGRVKTEQQKEYVQNFFKKYEIQFPTNKIGEKLNAQQLQIQQLKKTILQMASRNSID